MRHSLVPARSLIALVGLVIVLAACGSNGDDAAGDGVETTEVTEAAAVDPGAGDGVAIDLGNPGAGEFSITMSDNLPQTRSALPL